MRRAIPSLIFLWVCGALQASGQVITPSIEASVTSGPSPLAVSFNATGTRHSNSSINTDRFHELLYLWDYDDPGSGTWAPTGKSRNHMSGALGAHVFEPSAFTENCGGKACETYDVELKVRDGNDNEKSETITISVYDPNSTGVNGWGDSGETVCISRTADHQGCPAVAAKRDNQTGSVQTILDTEIGRNGFRRVLFHSGQTWSMTGPFDLSRNGPGLLGSYGGGKFTINFSIAKSSAFRLSGDDWRIQDVHFTGNVQDKSMFQSFSQTKNLLLQRTSSASNTFRQIFEMSVQTLPAGGDDTMHRYVSIVDNDWGTLRTTGSYYQIYVAAWGLNILGNEFGETPNTHTIRVETGEEVLISNNKLGPPRRSATTIHLRDLPAKNCPACPGRPFCGRRTKFYVVQDNDFICNGYTCIGVGMQTCSEAGVPIEAMPQEDFVFERNFFRGVPRSDLDTASAINPHSENGPSYRFMVRNNIADTTYWRWTGGFMGGPGFKINNNTCYRSDTSSAGPAVCVTPQGAEECYNNVMYAPNWSHTIRWLQTESWGGSCKNASNNFDNGLTGNISRKPFVSNSPSKALDFAPGTGSELIDSGRKVSGMFDDQSGYCRVGTRDAGAVEERIEATPCDPGGSPGPAALGPPGKPVLYP
jgi:hypothetical protein